ncbi:MAG: transglutaminase-like domain-containing protein [Lachnospiraceae bacterium]|nr:transglutaminase-like domain-containing protein [Lachnospiraceae bacterium]
MLSRIEKLIYKKEINDNHLVVGEITQQKQSNRLFLCLFKGFLIFIATYCSICGLLDAFEISYNKPVIIIAFIFFSAYVSMLYYNKFVFYLFYIVLFLAFTIELARYYAPVYSGFQAVINIIFENYSDYFALSTVREAQELVADRYLTVTFAALFMGAFIAILLNVAISGYMNAGETALVTFPFIEIPVFIQKIPPITYLFGLLFVYTCIIFLQLSGHSRMQVKGKRTHEFLRFKRRKENTYSYQADTPVFMTSLVISLAVSVILTVILFIPASTPGPKVAGNVIRKQTEEYVKIYIQTGLSGLFDAYSSTGGLANGKLGGVSQVRPDFETDLNVSFVPINFDTVYLKAYTGTIYTRSEWFESEKDFSDFENTRDYNLNNHAKMEIENIDGGLENTFLPYFSGRKDLEYAEGRNDLYYVSYTPYLRLKDFEAPVEDELLKDPEYYDYVYTQCLEVPDYLKETLDNVIEPFDTIEETDVNRYRIACFNAVYSYFFKNFDYTMSPGSTPTYRRDYVEYFLNSQKRGFCAHFASATVMLLREMGVPARYCEGYCIPISLVYDDAILTDNDYSEWYSGESLTEIENVIKVPVNDSYAHAWIEIYLDGYGFVPFEATIPSFGDDDVSPSLYDFGFLFSSLSSNTLNYESLGNFGQNQNNTNFSAKSILEMFDINTSSVASTLFVVFSVVAVAFVLYLIVRLIILRIKLAVYKANNDEYNLVMYEYNKLVKMLRRKGFIKKKNPLPDDVKESYDLYIAYYNNTHKKKKEIDTEKLFEYYERIMYS